MSLEKSRVQYCRMDEAQAGQRIDNYLLNKLKGVPKSRVYRLLRKGEVRVNKKRIPASYRLRSGDVVRIPPVLLAEKAAMAPPAQRTRDLLAQRILYEDDFLLVLNKPAGMSVHLGSTVRIGIIEAMRYMYPELPQLELGHRLDSETSGCLVLAKKKRILRELHAAFREGKVNKIYQTLTQGKWKDSELRIQLPLHKDYQDGSKHVVEVDNKGKMALSIFRTVKSFKRIASLMEVKLQTGRTHQIRVHAKAKGHCIAGDDRYGDPGFNKLARLWGLKRLFLHAWRIDFTLPSLSSHIKVEAPLDADLIAVLNNLEQYSHDS